MTPVVVARGESLGWRRRLGRVAVEPAADVVGVHLLAPDQTGTGLPQDVHLLLGGAFRSQSRVELVSVRPAVGNDLIEVGDAGTACRILRPVQPQPQLPCGSGIDSEPVP